MLIYSAHDTQIGMLWQFLNLDFENIPFCSFIQMELHKNENNYFVQFLTNGKSVKIGGCQETMCPYK